MPVDIDLLMKCMQIWLYIAVKEKKKIFQGEKKKLLHVRCLTRFTCVFAPMSIGNITLSKAPFKNFSHGLGSLIGVTSDSRTSPPSCPLVMYRARSVCTAPGCKHTADPLIPACISRRKRKKKKKKKKKKKSEY